MRISRILLFFSLSICSLEVFSQYDSVAVSFSKTITADELSKHLHIFASDEFEGRETGTKGQKMAAEYLADFFKEKGLKSIHEDGSFYQTYYVENKYYEGVSISNGDKEYTLFDDFYYLFNIVDSSFSFNEIYFAGYGMEAGNYSDYKGVDVKGKAVMLLSGGPEDLTKHSVSDSVLNKWKSDTKLKVSHAQSLGAAVVFVINPDFNQTSGRVKYYNREPRMSLVQNASTTGTPVFYVSEEMGKSLAGKFDINSWKAGKKGKWIKTELKVDIKRRVDVLPTENVVAMIEGESDEYIILTAHYDHLGKRGEDIYNGADDDGSGTVTLLEIAEAFSLAAEKGIKPSRNIIFMAVSGEEKGLLGSAYYVDNPLVPLDKTIANLNIDMIGRTDENHHKDSAYVYIIGSDRLSMDLHDLSENVNATYTEIDLDYTYNNPNDPNKFYYRSDHYNFAKNNIPVIFYFKGVHEDYHQPTDTADKIEYSSMEKIGRLIFHTAWELANRKEKLRLNTEIE